jgi:cardiolipin synthase
MSGHVSGASCYWLCSGSDFFNALLAAIDSAERFVCLESYIYATGQPGERFRDGLVRARQRGVRVRVLLDALGSYSLPRSFWEPLNVLGGEVRYFNPLSLNRLGFRNHRKLLVVDQQVGFVGGFNIAPEYEGDGVKCGWCDLGVKIQGPLAVELAASFEAMWSRADSPHKRFIRLRKSSAKRTVLAPYEQLLLSGPGRGPSPIKRAMLRDLAHGSSVQFIVGYFLPTWRFRRHLVDMARRGGKVQLILAAKSDVALSLLASRSLYRRLLGGGVEIYEYQPQILHAKLYIIDEVVYVGSANLDQRSLNINYELMIRFTGSEVAAQAREVFQGALSNCVRVTPESWRASRSLWSRIKQRLAYWVLVRLDPSIARRQWRRLPD